MAIQVQLRRGTTAQNNSFTGAVGEVTVDTDKDTAVVHDGATAGGYPLAKESGGSLTNPSIVGGTINNATIGATTPSTVASTNFSYTGTLTGGTGVINIGSGQVVKDANGNVGIGTSAPVATLHAEGTFLVGNGISGAINYPQTGALIIGSTSSESLVLRSNAVERMRIDSAGNVGIGTSSPATQLAVGRAGANTELRVLRSNEFSDFYGSIRTSGLDVALDGAKTATYRINVDPENATANSTFIVNIDNTERLRITASGNVGIGTSSPATKLDVIGAIRASTGILFGTDTAAVNTLDDYEEGTWTPVLGGSGGTSGQTYGTQVGTYTKVGNLVCAVFETTLTAKGTITTNAQIQGLPFSVNAASNGGLAFSKIAFLSLVTSQLVGVLAVNGTVATLRQAGLNGDNTNLTTTNINDNTSIVGCFIYRT